MSDSDKEMGYSEYQRRRRILEKRIRAAQYVLAVATDPRYTVLSPHGEDLALRELDYLRGELHTLRETFNSQQTKRGVSQ